MNILFLVPDVDLGLPRGDSVHVRELATHLARLGHAITLVTPNLPREPIPGIRHVDRPTRTISQILLAQKLARGWADVIYERRMTPKLSSAVSVLTGIPYVLEVNGILEDETRGQARRPKVRTKLKARIRRFMLKGAARIIAVSRGIRDHLVTGYRLDPRCVVVVPNGANTTLFRPLDKGTCRREVGLARDGPVICFVGNMVRWQGVDVLVRAVAQLKTRTPAPIALLVGGGPELDRLQSLASSLGVSHNVRFVGPVPYEKVPIYIGASDVCLAPFEGSRKASPIKIFEYLACARPVIASDVDEIGEFLRSCGGGLVVPPNNVSAVADAIFQLLANPIESATMGALGGEVVIAERSWLNTARRVGAILEDIRKGPADRGRFAEVHPSVR